MMMMVDYEDAGIGGVSIYILLFQVKREHYKALSHFYTALGLLDHEVGARY